MFKNKSMRSQIFALLFVFLSAFSFSNSIGQNSSVITPDSRLYECFDSSYVQQTLETNPALIAYYNFYLDNSYYVSSLKQPKAVTGENINKVTVNEDLSKKKTIYFNEKTYDAKAFNVLKYNFKTQDSNFTTYLWKEADLAIVFLPRVKIAAAYKEYCKKNNIPNK